MVAYAYICIYYSKSKLINKQSTQPRRSTRPSVCCPDGCLGVAAHLMHNHIIPPLGLRLASWHPRLQYETCRYRQGLEVQLDATRRNQRCPTPRRCHAHGWCQCRCPSDGGGNGRGNLRRRTVFSSRDGRSEMHVKCECCRGRARI